MGMRKRSLEEWQLKRGYYVDNYPLDGDSSIHRIEVLYVIQTIQLDGGVRARLETCFKGTADLSSEYSAVNAALDMYIRAFERAS